MKVVEYEKAPVSYVSRPEAASILRVSVRTVSRYQQRGLLRFERHGRETRILLEDVRQLQQTPATELVRVDGRRLRLLMARVMMLELQLKDAMDVLDGGWFPTKTKATGASTA